MATDPHEHLDVDRPIHLQMTIERGTPRASRLLVAWLALGLTLAACGSDDDVIDDDDHRTRR